ncbi:MAG TPA: protocatechuate 3,4-dioxygenase subunit alpha [Candidatus Binataceae bacterium]|nr:protocatechuate 3,4-dioxygenase subunit alpha [Candidatus Binataceae bacterium]
MSRLTPSQTIGPFFHRALLHEGWNDLAARGAAGERIAIEGRVRDGDGAPVGDAMVEIWQANAAGRYDHPADRQEDGQGNRPIDPNFHGFGRVATDSEGRFRLRTVKPGAVPGEGGAMQAPHINVSVFARGLLKRLATRLYFPDEPLNDGDPLLSAIPAKRRATLVARAAAGGTAERVLHFDIVLQGADETVFFDV